MLRETEDLMNKIYFYYFIFLFIPRASAKEFTKIHFINIPYLAFFFFWVIDITSSPRSRPLIKV